LIGFPKGTPPEISVKELDLLWKHPNYKTNTRVVHWAGADLEENDDFKSPREILEIIKEKNKEEWTGDLAFWARGNRFVIAHVLLTDPENN